jgi:hypothetical protein
MTSNLQTKYMVLIGAGVVVAVGIFGLASYGPAGLKSAVQGAIGQRDVYRDSNGSSTADGNTNAEFAKLYAIGQFKALAGDSRFKALAADSNFTNLLSNSQFVSLVGNAQFVNSVANLTRNSNVASNVNSQATNVRVQTQVTQMFANSQLRAWSRTPSSNSC